MVPIDNEFWRTPGYKQRMKSKEWAEILLANEDKGIIKGRIRTFVATKLGYGVVEISLKPLENIVGEEV